MTSTVAQAQDAQDASSPPSAVLDRMALAPMHRAFLTPYLAALQQKLGRDLLRVRAYGSRVRGNARPDSDLDLLVTLRSGADDDLPSQLSWQLCERMLRDYPELYGAISVISLKHERWLSELLEGSLYPHVVEAEGVDLYFSPELPEDAYVGVGERPPITMVYDEV